MEVFSPLFLKAERSCVEEHPSLLILQLIILIAWRFQLQKQVFKD